MLQTGKKERLKLHGVLIVTVLAMLLVPSWALAQETGNPTTLTPKGGLTVGMAGGYIFEQRFRDYDLDRTSSSGASDSESKSAKFTDDRLLAASLTYGLTDWLNFYAQAGVVDGGKWVDNDIATGQDWQARLKSAFVWAVGGKVRVWEHKSGLGVLAGARYLRYDNRRVADWENTSTGLKADDYWTTDDRLDYWQVDATATLYWRQGLFTPYIGGGWSYSAARFSGRWTELSNPDSFVNYESTMYNRDQFTALAGLVVEPVKGLKVMIQGSFLSRTELTAGLSYTF